MKKIKLSVKIIFTMLFAIFSIFTYTKEQGVEAKTTLIIHYQKSEDLDWDLWIWPKGMDGHEYKFTKEDKFGKVAKVELDGVYEEVGFLVRIPDWSKKDVEDDRYIQVKNGFAEVWLKSKDKNIYTTNIDRQLTPEKGKTKLIVHYQKITEDDWDLWIWPKGMDGHEYKFEDEDSYGLVSEIVLDGEYKEVGYIVRTPNWGKKDVEHDRYITVENGISEIWLKSKDAKTYYENPDGLPKSYDKLSATIYYNRIKNDYKNWVLFANGKKFKFVKDKYGVKANVEITAKDLTKIDFRILKITDKKKIDTDLDSRSILKFDDNGYAKVYINQGDKTIYTNIEKAKEPRKILSANIDSLNSIVVRTNKPFDTENSIKVSKAKIKNIEVLKGEKNQATEIRITTDKNLDLLNKYKLYIENFGMYDVSIGNVISDDSFDKQFAYKVELGAIYTKENTIFRVWAPTATKVNLLVYNGENAKKMPMKKIGKGVYELKLNGDKLGMVYNYEVYVNGEVNEATDPYAKSTTINGNRSVVVNPVPLESNYVKIDTPIIYELHVRDLSIHKESKIKQKGKFLGVIEEGTKSSKGQITGFDYIKSLGVTHVQLLPIYDFSKYSVDENDQFSKYNWGYDPVNYNTPEGSYSTNPNDPNSRIIELQQLVKKFHDNNIGVIMDVVYNHVFSTSEHSFEKIVPQYYFRHNENGGLTNGSGCGNDVASERQMARKYIVDSVVYLAKTYKFDGFRFDLMGLLDVTTMKTLRDELMKINPNIIILGEGWDLGTLPKSEKSAQYNANKLENIAFFNDDIRDGIKGATFGGVGQGFATGKLNQEERVLRNIIGGQGVKTYMAPNQIINYVEAHDNLTLWDQIEKTNSQENEEVRINRHRLSTSIVLLSQGIPFIHAGQEFARTKHGDENSYKSSDEINWIDWDRAYENRALVEYVRQLISIRKANNMFNLKSYDKINKVLQVLKKEDQLIAYQLKENDLIYVAHNASMNTKEIRIENGKYIVLVKDDKANVNGINEINVRNGKIKVNPISTLVIKKVK